MNKKIYMLLVTIVFLVTISLSVASHNYFVYDKNGNLIHDGTYFMEYNGFNKLATIYDGSDNVTLLMQYTYHPITQKVLFKKVYDDGGTWKETIFYVSDSFVSKKNASGMYNETYVYLDHHLVGQKTFGSGMQWVHTDNQGSVVAVTDTSGSLVEKTIYKPHGEVLSGGTASRFGYEGQEVDVKDIMNYFNTFYHTRYGFLLQAQEHDFKIYGSSNIHPYLFKKGNYYR